jgi:drug/metabolite transporter (DMT)-like permease
MNKLESVRATTIINGFSYALSGMAGWLLFQERISWLWCLGMCMIMFGIFLISYQSQPQLKQNEVKVKDL